MVKIGITIKDLKNFKKKKFCNGLHQNIIFIYNLLDSIFPNNIFYLSDNLIENSIENSIGNSIYINDISSLKKLDIILIIGVSLNNDVKNELIKCKKVLIEYHLGNLFVSDTFKILSNNKAFYLSNNFKEIWILPSYEFSIDYYKYISQNDNVLVAPYVWEPYYIKNKLDNVDMTNINVGVFEPNLTPNKSSFIPIIICEKAKDIIENAMIFGSKNLALNNSSFKDFCKLSLLFNSGRLTCEDRHIFFEMMNKHCNVVISYVDNWDLNYLFLECFYLGIPLIHNSYILKDWGYYYPKCDVLTAVKHLENLKKNGFDRKAYIEKHKEILFKYSIKNPDNIKFFKDRILSSINSN